MKWMMRVSFLCTASMLTMSRANSILREFLCSRSEDFREAEMISRHQGIPTQVLQNKMTFFLCTHYNRYLEHQLHVVQDLCLSEMKSLERGKKKGEQKMKKELYEQVTMVTEWVNHTFQWLHNVMTSNDLKITSKLSQMSSFQIIELYSKRQY